MPIFPEQLVRWEKEKGSKLLRKPEQNKFMRQDKEA